ncbi:tetratricopeptide repeat protein [Xanthomonas sp. AmX2]|uniref:tetratricopeptide repeat protein n=1 Tax=Xanthomonas sp. TaxID=29446 RepID=UPI001981703C|nr:tetratricopeptide repeat protein [Xanthomonas sp.]MBN6149526.1 tetratricopeptide repeat protein [Xanthomonas sp.]
MHGNTRWKAAARVGALLLSGLLAQATSAQVGSYLAGAAAKRPGHEYRKELVELLVRLDKGQGDDARLLDRVTSYCRAHQRPGLRAVSVADTREYEDYLAAHADGQPTEWIDVSCVTALQMRGYAAAAKQQWPQALDWLEQAIALGPYFAPAYTERGYVLAKLGRTDEAIASYRHALQLSETYPLARAVQPLALRGIGSMLIDQQDLAGARASFQRSLQLEPGNRTALHELDYIARLEARDKQP